MCGARPRLRGVLKSLPPPRVGLAVPRVAHMGEEPVLARRPAVLTPVMGEYRLHVYYPLTFSGSTYPGWYALSFRSAA